MIRVNMELSIWILLSSLFISAVTASSCHFPSEWMGKWYQDTFGELEIKRHEITRKGRCAKKQGTKYLIQDIQNCYRCLVFTPRHKNIIQYKQSYCFNGNSIEDICNKILGDAPLHTIVRVQGKPEPCPFHGFYTFTYSNSTTNSGKHCSYPLSQIRPCADESKFKFVYRHCKNMPGTSEQELNFQCLATWENGEKYLYGKFSVSGLPMFRCFMHGLYGMSGDMSMTADATCLGLQSPSVGFSTMKLSREEFDGDNWPSENCKYPNFLATGSHWRDMSNKYEIEVHHNRQTFKVKSKFPRMYGYKQHDRFEMKMVVRCIGGVAEGSSYVKEYLTHVTDDKCSSSYRCLRLIKRAHNVLELYIGVALGSRNTACSHSMFIRGEKHILIPSGIQPTPCPRVGSYNFSDKTSDCKGTFQMGCGTSSEVVVVKDCPARGSLHKKSAEYMNCLLTFVEDSTEYVIIEKDDSQVKRASCLAFRQIEGGVDVQEDNECIDKSMVVRNKQMHYVLFAPKRDCPPQERPTGGNTPNPISNDGPKPTPGKHITEVERNHETVISVTDDTSTLRTSCLLLSVCLLLTTFLAISER